MTRPDCTRRAKVSQRGDNAPPPDCAFPEVLLCGRDVVALRQVLDDLLADPAAIEDARLGVGEAPLQVRHEAAVGRLLREVVGVLEVDFSVRAACLPRAALLAGWRGDGLVAVVLPRIGPPLPVASIGCPLRNSAARFQRAGAALAGARHRRPTKTVVIGRRMVNGTRAVARAYKEIAQAQDDLKATPGSPGEQTILIYVLPRMLPNNPVLR